MSSLEERIIQQLLNDLQSTDPSTRQNATQNLWERWFNEKGTEARTALMQATRLMERGEFVRAEGQVNRLLDTYPDFAEAFNKRATIRYLMGDFTEAAADCEQVITLKPYHFGALHGLGLCRMQLGEYPAALAALRRAVVVQPHALVNQQLIAECLTHLS